MKKKLTLINIITSILLQIVTILYGFITSKLILIYFGSNINGLVSSLTQFLNYITLVEGGISGVIIASLYKPLVNNDINKISSIIKTAKNFYKKIGVIFIVYSLIISIIYPLVFNVELGFWYVFILSMILSINLLIQYMFSLTYKNLLMADKKVYIVSISQIIIYILNIILTYISVKIYPNIHIFKLISGILFVIQPVIYTRYINKNYKLEKDAKEDKNLLKNRWNGFAINIAAFIHFSTDTSILTIFSDLLSVSIYSVYNLVTSGLRSIVNSIANAINPSIGQAYARGNVNDINNALDIYEFIIFNTVFYLFSIAGLLITPFVLLYTEGVYDANYNQPIFGILLLISEAIYLIKYPHLNLAYGANKYKELTAPAIIEAVINIIVSIILVKQFGLIGVAIGTICGMTYRMIYQVKFTKKLISDRKERIFYKKIVIFLIATIIALNICIFFISEVQITILSWIIHAIIYCIIFAIIFIIFDCIFFKDEIRYLLKYLQRN